MGDPLRTPFRLLDFDLNTLSVLRTSSPPLTTLGVPHKQKTDGVGSVCVSGPSPSLSMISMVPFDLRTYLGSGVPISFLKGEGK